MNLVFSEETTRHRSFTQTWRKTSGFNTQSSYTAANMSLYALKAAFLSVSEQLFVLFPSFFEQMQSRIGHFAPCRFHWGIQPVLIWKTQACAANRDVYLELKTHVLWISMDARISICQHGAWWQISTISKLFGIHCCSSWYLLLCINVMMPIKHEPDVCALLPQDTKINTNLLKS